MIGDLPYIAANLAKNAAAPVVIPLRRGRGSLGMDGAPEAVLRTLGALVDALGAGGGSLAGTGVVELGPGRTPELAAALTLLGADGAVGADVTVQVPPGWEDGIEPFVAALAADAPLLAAAGASPETVRARATQFAADGWPVRFVGFDGRRLPLPPDSSDLVCSKSVLEHVQPADVDPLLTDLRRVLRPGGFMVHAIDLRDHMFIDNDEVTGDWLRALRYPDALFKWMFSRRSTAINRLRAPEWRDAFERHDFEVEAWQERRYPLPAGHRPERLQPRWRDLPPEVLEVGQIVVTLRLAASAVR